MVILALFFFLGIFQGEFVAFSDSVQISEEYITRTWGVEDGLPVNTVNSIIQDKEGYIWFTTYDGIVRFDGVDFKVYNHSNTPGMTQNRAVFLHQQEDAGIWATLENGGVLFIEKGETVTHFDEDNGFTSANTTYMMEDSKNRMWFATFDGMYVYDHGVFSKPFNRDTPEKNRVSFIYEDVDGSIWASTFDGLLHLDGNQQKVYDVNPGTPENEFRMVLRMHSGELLIGGRMGLYQFDGEKLVLPQLFRPFKHQTVSYFYENDSDILISTDKALYTYDGRKFVKIKENDSYHSLFWYFYKDSNNELWMLTTRGELAILKNNKVFLVKEADKNFPDFYFNSIIQDRENNLWAATARNGIMRIKRSRVKVLAKEEGLTGDNILGLFEDSRGRFWAGTRDYGLNMIENDEITQFREPRINSDIVHTIAEDKEGNIWVGHYQEGINKISDAGIESYNLGFGAGINDVHAIYVSRDSSIWVGTYGGLVKFDPENKNHIIYTEEDGLAGNLVRYIVEDAKGGLWIGTVDGGVSYFYEETFKNYTTEQGLSADNIRSLYVDEYNPETIWVGTENKGLNRIREGEIDFVGVQDGLPDHIIHYISQDSLGWLWMSSNHGVFKIRKDELNDFLDGEANNFGVIHFGREEGMRNPECNGSFQQGGLRTSNGTFWFSTQEGIAIFEVDPESTNKIPPPILINQINTNGEGFTNDEVNFDPGVQSFSVDFKALTFTTPEKTRFRYMLEGYDEDWIEVNNERSANYSQVPPGTYTFKVLAANNDGVWSKDPATAMISIEPLFYKKTWFYILLILVILGGTVGFSKVRYRYLMKRQKKLQEKVREQTNQIREEKNEIKKQNAIIEKQAHSLEDINKAKDRFFSIIAHDLRNPFQVMLGFSEFLLTSFENMEKEELRDSLQEIKGSSKSLFSLVENLLSWASLQTGKLKLSPEVFMLDEPVEKNINLFFQASRQKKIELIPRVDSGIELKADKNMIDAVVRNLISNAIKFTKAGGTIEITAYKQNKICYLKIADSGIGMSEKMVSELMKLDSNTSRLGTENERGTGLGLIICKDMVNLHSGTINVESEEGKGTTFIITLPESPETASDRV